jgi:polysaccharide export outer membrane protein
MKRSFRSTSLLFAILACAHAQDGVTVADVPAAAEAYATPAVGATGASQAEANYILGAGDQLSFTVTDLDDFTDKTFRVDMHGDLNLPLAGRVHAGGLTMTALEKKVADLLAKILKDPQVVANISEFGSQPVSILGAVGAPGIRQLEGRKTLFAVLSLAGGLRPDAGNTINITRELTRGPIPLPSTRTDASGKFSVASVSVKSILNATNPAENIVILPGDVVSVSKADLVYAVGSIKKPGGFLIGQNSSLTTLQVVSLAEGLDKTAAADKAKILRVVPGSSTRAEIAVNLKQLMAGRGADLALQSDDILFVPSSGAKSASYRTLDAVVNIATGMAVYGKY